MTDTTFYTLPSVLDNWSREYITDRETFFDLIDRNPNLLATGTDYTTIANYTTNITAHCNNPYANDPNWTCIYNRDAGIDRRDEYILGTSHFVNEDIRQIYIDKSAIATACPQKSPQISERELLKFLEEE